MSRLQRFPLRVCTSYVECVPSTPAPIHMPLLIPLLPFVALLLTGDTAKKAQTVGRGIYASALTIAAVLVVDSNTVRYLMLTAPVR